jgi:hypothetical protein
VTCDRGACPAIGIFLALQKLSRLLLLDCCAWCDSVIQSFLVGFGGWQIEVARCILCDAFLSDLTISDLLASWPDWKTTN